MLLNLLSLARRIKALEENGGGGDTSALVNKTDIAPEFSDATNYYKGDLVYYNGLLYEFQLDHTAGAWEQSEVQNKDLSDILNTISDRVDDVAAIMVKGYHTATSNTISAKEITLDNRYQQLVISVLTADCRTVHLITQMKNDRTVDEVIFSTPDQTVINLSTTNNGEKSIVITLPQYAQVSIMSTEGFTISNYTP